MKIVKKGPMFFATPSDFRAWLAKNHASEAELSVGFYKRDSGKPSITWPESVDVALCYGWIDGVRHSIDAGSYRIRFTPRKPGSTWSAINVRRVAELTKLGLMRPAGVNAFEARKGEKTGIYAYEQRKQATLPPAYEKQFRAKKRAWKFFQAAALVSPHRNLLRDQREAGSHAPEAAGGVDGGFWGRTFYQGSSASREEMTKPGMPLVATIRLGPGG